MPFLTCTRFTWANNRFMNVLLHIGELTFVFYETLDLLINLCDSMFKFLRLDDAQAHCKGENANKNFGFCEHISHTCTRPTH